MKKIKRLKTSLWSLKIAWKLSKGKLIGWGGLCILLAMFPSILTLYYKTIVYDISSHINDGSGSYQKTFCNIIILGLILSVIGLSNRINGDLLYMIMYDSYYLGMQSIMMDTIQQLDIEQFRDKDIKDEYNAIIVRAGALTDFISSACMLISRIIGTALLLVIAYMNSILIFIISIIYIAFTCFMNYRSAERNRGKVKRIREAERAAKRLEDIPSNLSVAKELRIFSAKSRVISAWEDAYNEVSSQKKEQNFHKEKDGYLLGLGFYVFNISSLAYSIFMVFKRRMMPDVFLVIFSLCQSLSTYISDITKSFLDADYGLYSLERQKEFIDHVQELSKSSLPKEDKVLPQKAKSDQDVIQIENLCYGYTDDNSVLKNVSLKIRKGETVALVGYNGSGKTTLVKLLISLYRQKQGKLYLNGYDYDTINADYINSQIGVFFQNYTLFHASLKENVGFGDITYIDQEELIYEALHKGGIDDIVETLADGIHSWLFKTVKRDGYELSGGQKQRVAVSRAYMNNKDILIFDEPSAALDPIAEMKQFEEINNKIKGKTAILISHRIGFARMADRIIVLNDGCVAEEGSHDELMRLNGLYSSFYKQQAEWYKS